MVFYGSKSVRGSTEHWRPALLSGGRFRAARWRPFRTPKRPVRWELFTLLCDSWGKRVQMLGAWRSPCWQQLGVLEFQKSPGRLLGTSPVAGVSRRDPRSPFTPRASCLVASKHQRDISAVREYLSLFLCWTLRRDKTNP